MEFIIRKIDTEDWDDLLIWRNDELTRKMFINGGIVNKEDHYSYMDKMSKNKNREQFIFIHDNKKIGTIRIDKLNDEFVEFSYTINPKYRGNGYGSLMMKLFLFGKVGKYRCEIKPENIGSIRMAEKNGFKFRNKSGEILIYEKVTK
jgi:RimJ/RimL family protein N-acetyltransferase